MLAEADAELVPEADALEEADPDPEEVPLVLLDDFLPPRDPQWRNSVISY